MDQTKILDVKINKITVAEVLEKIKGFLLSNKQCYIVTLNPEMVIEAQKNDYFKKIINGADLVIPDGIGIVLANKFLNRQALSKKITGIDLAYNICESKLAKDKKIYLLGAGQGIAEKASEVLSRKYNYLNIVGAEIGISNLEFFRPKRCCPPWEETSLGLGILRFAPNLDDNKFYKLNEELIQRINRTKPDIILVAFGSPKQEEWIYENLKKIPSVRLAVGVGGSFDFISGKIKRAPLIFQKLWLEWLWRLILEPQRIRRIYNATVKFSWLILKKSFKYRYKNIK